jgi:hypothetical protein
MSMTYQCKRRVWRKADIPSIKTSTTTVEHAQKAKIIGRKIIPYGIGRIKPMCKTIVQSTSDNSVNIILTGKIIDDL